MVNMEHLFSKSVVATFQALNKGGIQMKSLISYILSTIASLCFVSGIAVLSGGKD